MRNYSTMDYLDIIVFGDPAIDTRFVLELAGASDLEPFDPLRSVFETELYDVTISDQRYRLLHTAGIPSSHTDRSSLQAPEVLKNLYYSSDWFSKVHLLIYVVRTDKPTSKNFSFFTTISSNKMLLSSLFRPRTHLRSFRGLTSFSLWMVPIRKVMRLIYRKP